MDDFIDAVAALAELIYVKYRETTQATKRD